MKPILPNVQSIVALGLSLVLLPTNVAFSAQNSTPQPLGRTPYLNTGTTTATVKTTVSPQAAAAPAPAAVAGPNASAPRDMKLLIVGLDGNEPDFAAVKFFLDTLGIPYDIALTLDSSVNPPVTRPLPPLTDGVKGFYQGIFLTNGNLGYCTTTCQSTLSPDQWASLDNYALNFGVRTVAYYAFPEVRYGLVFTGTAISATDAAPETIAFTSAAAPIFPYLNTVNPLKFTNAYVYLADAVQAAGETTTPLMTIRGKTVAALHTTADGREYMGLTLDNNPNLLHSMALGYGILNWLTKGVFIGGRKVYMTPQVDDHFLPDDEYVSGVAACTPTGFVNDPTYDPAGACPSLRITGADLKNISDWQTNWNRKPQFARFKVTHAFNGFGTLNATGKFMTKDSLVVQTQALRTNFFWLTHTWDHEDLDCYAPAANAGASTCVAANYAQSAAELTQNLAMAKQLRLPLDQASMVTPGISGLKNPDFLKAAVDNGIHYLVSDSSKPEYLPAIPNTGIRNPWQPSILMIPRRPTNIFYNTTTGLTGKPGSLPEEYNYFFGPNGIFKIGGTNTPFFSTTQTYANIIDRESDNLLSYLLRYEIYPQMYHQSNLYRYSGSKTLFTDVIDATFNKFAKISNLPVISLTQTDLGRELEAKMAVVTANVKAVLTPGQNLTVTGSSAANVVVTGVCFGTACESYGNQCISKVPITSGVVTTVPLVSGPCAVNPGLGAAIPGTAYQAVSNAQTTLDTLTATSTDTKLQDAIAVINDALDPSVWFSPTALDASSGKTYFNSLQKAASTLESLAKDKKTPAATATAIQAVLVSVAAASQQIANDALAAAVAAGVASKDLNTVQKEIANGDKSMSPNTYDTAIDHYGNAWTAAVKAINKLN